MINKITISKSTRKILHKDKRTLGMNGENLEEVLLFVLDEKVEGIGKVEVELPNGQKGIIDATSTEEGFELLVKSSLLSKTGFVKFQLRILHDEVEIFKSNIVELEVKESINATETIPDQYPTWIDTLEKLKLDLEQSEQERISNEEERQTAEEARQENFTEMQKTVESAASNIKDLKEDYSTNAEEETKKFNDNASEKTKEFNTNANKQTEAFNTNSDDKLKEYNTNHTNKMKEFNDNFNTKTDTFNSNAKSKLDDYNKNDSDKLNAYNDNTVLKEKAYNDNAKQKETEFESLANEKKKEYNSLSAELTAKIEQVQVENEALKTENRLIKEQIPSRNSK